VPTTFAQVQSAAAEILKRLEGLKLEETVRSVNELIGGMNDLVRSPALKATVERLPETVDNAKQTLDAFRQLAVHLDKEQGPLIDSVKATSKEASATLEEARAALQSVQSFVNPNSPFAVTLVTTLEELSAAAREVRLLADELDRNPTAIIRGRAVTERK